MKSTKIVKFLKLLDRQEVKQLRRLVSSPFFNEREQLSQLLDSLLKFYPEFNSENFTEEMVYMRAFGGKPFNKRELIKTTSQLYQLCTEFAIQQEMKTSSGRRQLQLMSFFHRKNNYDLFKGVLGEFNKSQGEQLARDNEYYSCQLEAETLFSVVQSQNDDRTGTHHLQELSNLLDSFYLYRKLKQLCYMVNMERVSEVKFDHRLLKEVHIMAVDPEYIKIPEIATWHAALKLLMTPDLERYARLKELLQIHDASFSPMQKRVLYTYLENSSGKIYPTKKARFEEVFHLYRLQMEAMVFKSGDSLVQGTFTNICTVGLYLKKYGWVAEFIESYKEHIRPVEFQEDTYNYNLARLHFSQQNFDETFRLLNQVEYNDIYIKLGAKRILCKACFEAEEYIVLESQLNAFRVFMHRMKGVRKDEISAQKNFINHLFKLIKLKTEPTSLGKEKAFREKIEIETNLAERVWFFEKLNEL